MASLHKRVMKVLADLSPDEYHRRHNQCPDGYHWEDNHCKKVSDSKGSKPAGKVEPTPQTHPRLFTKTGKRLFVQPNPKAELVLNPKYDEKSDNTYFAKSHHTDEKGVTKTIRHYTQDYVKRNKRKKFAKNHSLSHAMPKILDNLSRDLNSKDPNTRYRALAVAMADQGLFRVGNKESEKHGVRGLHNLQAKNVEMTDDGAVFKYTGKHGVEQKHTLMDPKIKSLVSELMKNKKPDEHLFSWKHEGAQHSLSPEDINKYFRSIGSPTSIHKLRSFHASRMASEALNQEVPAAAHKSDKAFLDHFKEKMKPIAEKLGHKSVGTTLSHYVDPTILEHFFERNHREMPKNILASVKPTDKLTIVSNPKLTDSHEAFHKWMQNHRLPNRVPDTAKWVKLLSEEEADETA